MQDYFSESIRIQRIDLFMKIFASGDCSREKKTFSDSGVSELTDELMRKVRSHNYS